MKHVLLGTLAFLSLSSFASADTAAETGMGGMSECISLSLRAALDEHAKTHPLFPIPKIEVTEGAALSNGIDIDVTVDLKTTYHVIGTANSERNAQGVPVGLLGCLNAHVGYVESN